MKVKIGTWHEKESRDLTYCPSYYAADTETLRTQVGDVDAFVDFTGGYMIPMPYWLLVSIPATRVSGRLYSGFGGVNFASRELKVGEFKHYHIQSYAYQIKDLVEAGRLTLDPKFQFLMDDPGWKNGPKTWDELKILVEEEK